MVTWENILRKEEYSWLCGVERHKRIASFPDVNRARHRLLSCKAEETNGVARGRLLGLPSCAAVSEADPRDVISESLPFSTVCNRQLFCTAGASDL